MLALLVVVSAVGTVVQPAPSGDVTVDSTGVDEDIANARPSDAPAAATSPTPTAEASTQPAPTSSVTQEDLEAQIAAAPQRSALALLGSLAVKGRAAKTGYDRDVFGSAWTDTDRNGCDTRNDILGRDLDSILYKPGTGDCAVLSGALAPDPYTGQSIDFVRGDYEIDIDHVVALGDAWQKGASGWVPGKRLAFANDPLNLMAVDASANRQKGDGDAATWLPPNKGFRCRYVARQVAVKAKYEVWVTAAERIAIARILSGCPGVRAPGGSAPTMAPVRVPQSRAAAPMPRHPAKPKAVTDPRYPFCKDLPPGLGPYVRGKDPEYEWYRDNDKDGMVCE